MKRTRLQLNYCFIMSLAVLLDAWGAEDMATRQWMLGQLPQAAVTSGMTDEPGSAAKTTEELVEIVAV